MMKCSALGPIRNCLFPFVLFIAAMLPCDTSPLLSQERSATAAPAPATVAQQSPGGVAQGQASKAAQERPSVGVERQMPAKATQERPPSPAGQEQLPIAGIGTVYYASPRQVSPITYSNAFELIRVSPTAGTPVPPAPDATAQVQTTPAQSGPLARILITTEKRVATMFGTCKICGPSPRLHQTTVASVSRFTPVVHNFEAEAGGWRGSAKSAWGSTTAVPASIHRDAVKVSGN